MQISATGLLQMHAFLTPLFSILNRLSLSLCTIGRYLNSEAILRPLPCSSPLLRCVQREDEELGGHRWREVLMFVPIPALSVDVSRWDYTERQTHIFRAIQVPGRQRGHARHAVNFT